MAALNKRALLLAGIALLLGSSLIAEQVGYAARVLRKVSWKKSGGIWQPLPEKSPIDRGWQLRTDKESAVVVLFHPHGFLHLGERTFAIVDRRRLDEARGCENPQVVLLEGALRIAHASADSSRITVRCAEVLLQSPDMEGRTKGTDVRLRVGPELGTLIAVHEGEALVDPDVGEAIELQAGEWVLVGPDGAISVPPTPFNADWGPLDDSPSYDCCDFRIDPPELQFP